MIDNFISTRNLSVLSIYSFFTTLCDYGILILLNFMYRYSLQCPGHRVIMPVYRNGANSHGQCTPDLGFCLELGSTVCQL